ncbi:MAG: carboxypeptidase-like regulatory domain-containing protein [Bacteroidota bacterium]
MVTEEPKKNTAIINAEENRIYEIGTASAAPGRTGISLAGYVRDEKNGEAIPGVSVSFDNATTGVITDQFGYYAVTLPAGRH